MERLEARHFSFQSPGVLSTPSCWAELSNMWHRVIWASLQLERVGGFFAGFFFPFLLSFFLQHCSNQVLFIHALRVRHADAMES